MTNREWLNGLSDDEFANWLCDAMYDEDLSRTLGTDVYIGISQIKFAYTDSRLGLKQWLGERRDTDDIPFTDVVEVKHGEWLNSYRILEFPFECSACGEVAYEESNFCPNCGTYMKERKESK